MFGASAVFRKMVVEKLANGCHVLKFENQVRPSTLFKFLQREDVMEVVTFYSFDDSDNQSKNAAKAFRDADGRVGLEKALKDAQDKVISLNFANQNLIDSVDVLRGENLALSDENKSLQERITSLEEKLSQCATRVEAVQVDVTTVAAELVECGTVDPELVTIPNAVPLGDSAEISEFKRQLQFEANVQMNAASNAMKQHYDQMFFSRLEEVRVHYEQVIGAMKTDFALRESEFHLKTAKMQEAFGVEKKEMQEAFGIEKKEMQEAFDTEKKAFDDEKNGLLAQFEHIKIDMTNTFDAEKVLLMEECSLNMKDERKKLREFKRKSAECFTNLQERYRMTIDEVKNLKTEIQDLKHDNETLQTKFESLQTTRQEGSDVPEENPAPGGNKRRRMADDFLESFFPDPASENMLADFLKSIQEKEKNLTEAHQRMERDLTEAYKKNEALRDDIDGRIREAMHASRADLLQERRRATEEKRKRNQTSKLLATATKVVLRMMQAANRGLDEFQNTVVNLQRDIDIITRNQTHLQWNMVHPDERILLDSDNEGSSGSVVEGYNNMSLEESNTSSLDGTNNDSGSK